MDFVMCGLGIFDDCEFVFRYPILVLVLGE